MISDITLGQFFPGKSILHRLDPRTKIILAVFYIVALFVADTPIAFIGLILLTLTLVLVSKISIKVVIKGMKPIIFVLIFTSILNIFMTVGAGEPLFELGFIRVYTEGLVRAIFMSVRVIMLIVGTSMFLTYTTSPITLTDGIESLFKPFKKIGLPVHAFAMMMSIALRFIPTLVEETEKIMNAQKSRGADFSSGGLVKRAKALIPILVPLFVSSFKRADELATAMESRCYRGDIGRTKFVKLEYHFRDLWWILAFIALTAAVICSKVLTEGLASNGLIYQILFYKI